MSVIEDLRPTKKLRVIDLARKAGLDVSGWSRFKGGAERAAVNPKYCYEWSFLKPGELLVLNCWYDELYQYRGTVAIDVSMRAWATRNQAKHGKPVWTKRALKFDEAVQTAIRDKLPIKMILLDGTKRRADDPSARASTVQRRKLDTARWAITSYDYKTGKARLTRGARPTVNTKLGVMSDEIRRVLLQVSKLVATALQNASRAAALHPPRDRREHLVDTGGWAIALGQLGPGIVVEIWLDYCGGQPTPRFWVGFRASSAESIDKLLKLGSLSGMKEKLVRITSSQVSTMPFFHFKEALESFDTLVCEDYGPHYLGIYYQHNWPLSPQVLNTLAEEASAFIAMVFDDYQNTLGSERRSAPGPWARPNPRAEKAAVRHVTAFLIQSGYVVVSREREICGYDLHAKRGSEELHVEVKGCTGSDARFFISRREMGTGKRDSDWRLVVVTGALNEPKAPVLLTHAQMTRQFELDPIQWEARSRSISQNIMF